MDFDTVTWIWFIAGVLLMASEMLLPGLVVVFLGLGAVLVAAGRWMHLIDSELNSFTWWFILSLLSIVSLRSLFSRFSQGDVSVNVLSERAEAYGQIAEVITRIRHDSDEGRIRFQGTSWKATCDGDPIEPGSKVRILSQNGIVWIVEPVEENSVLINSK